MQNLICIVCPIGCSVDVDPENMSVTGNRCSRGEVYAREEIRAPKRVVTATVSVTDSEIRRLPVKTSSPCLREKIPALLSDIYKVQISLPVKTGDVIIADWNGEGFDVVAARTYS
ncbi:MAG: DUF1667 domain-containing protein [Treponema sp.]|nr:DUF1667 domain-containing protein [Treponema sp.]